MFLKKLPFLFSMLIIYSCSISTVNPNINPIIKGEQTNNQVNSNENTQISKNSEQDIKVESITIENLPSITLKISEKINVKAIVKYSNNLSDNNVIWSSDNGNVQVTQNGELTGIKEGESKIIATSKKDPSKSSSISIKIISVVQKDNFSDTTSSNSSLPTRSVPTDSI